MENKTKITAFKVRKIPLSKVENNKDYEVGVSVSNWDKNRYFVILKVANKVHDDLDKYGLVKVNLYYDESFASDNNYHTLVTFTMVAQIYDAELDKIIDTKKQDYYLNEKTKEFIPNTPAPANTVEGSIQGYWHKNKLVAKVEGPFSDADCKTIVSDVKIGTRYYFKGTPKQKLHKSELLAMKWNYRYNDGDLTEFNHASETAIGNTNIMNCTFHKKPKNIQVYAFFKNPSEKVMVEFEVPENNISSDSETQEENNDSGTCQNCKKLTKEELGKMFPNATNTTLEEVVTAFNEVNLKLGIDTCQKKAHFFAQIREESGSKLTPRDAESLDYSTRRLKDGDYIAGGSGWVKDAVNGGHYTSGEWKKGPFSYFKKNKSEADLYGRKDLDRYGDGGIQKANQQAIANRAYAKRNGNGDIASGDGWRYRGKGHIQLTGKDKYKLVNDKLKEKEIPLTITADNVNNNDEGIKASMAYWDASKLNALAEEGISGANVDAITKVINSSTDSYKERKEHFTKALNVFKVKQCDGDQKDASAQESSDGVLEEMKVIVDKHITYGQNGERASLSSKGLENLDCSETVGIYLYKLGVMPKLTSIHTGVMTTQADFRTAIGSNNIDLISGSTASNFKPKKGDIFVWRKSDGVGHTGIVYKYDEAEDLVTILESIGSVGSADETTNKTKGGYSGKGCSRTAVYKRSGKALAGHAGWKGYFRPKNYTKSL